MAEDRADNPTMRVFGSAVLSTTTINTAAYDSLMGIRLLRGTTTSDRWTTAHATTPITTMRLNPEPGLDEQN